MSGILAAMIGMITVRTKDGATQGDLLGVLRGAQTLAGVIQMGFVAIIVYVLGVKWELFGCILIGWAAGLFISVESEYFTSYAFAPTISIAQSALIGPANVVIQGMSVGMFACILPALVIASVILSAFALSGSVDGIALASTGLLSTLGITLATGSYFPLFFVFCSVSYLCSFPFCLDAYGPVADNAGGIAESKHLPIVDLFMVLLLIIPSLFSGPHAQAHS
jgi:Na+/H+-translocating membrane pyrophosphatase